MAARLIERREFTLLAGLVPGPKEPSDRAIKSILHRILRIFVDHGPAPPSARRAFPAARRARTTAVDL